MRRAIIIAALLSAGSALADWAVKATAGNPAVVSVTGGSVDKVSSELYAVTFNGTDNYLDTGKIINGNYSMRMLLSIDGIGGGTWNVYAGVFGAATYFGFAEDNNNKWHGFFGDASVAGATGPSLGWSFCTVDGNMVAENGTNVVALNGHTVDPDTTGYNLFLGVLNVTGSRAYYAPITVARWQILDGSSNVVQDASAQSDGRFYDAISTGYLTVQGAAVTATNITNTTLPAQNWK